MYMYEYVSMSTCFLELLPATRGPMPHPQNTFSRGSSQRAPLRAPWAPKIIRASTFPFLHWQDFHRFDLAHKDTPAVWGPMPYPQIEFSRGGIQRPP